MSNPNWAKGLGRTNINKQLEELDMDMAITRDQYYQYRDHPLVDLAKSVDLFPGSKVKQARWDSFRTATSSAKTKTKPKRKQATR